MTEQNNKPLTAQEKHQQEMLAKMTPEQRATHSKQLKKYDNELKYGCFAFIAFVALVFGAIIYFGFIRNDDTSTDSDCNTTYIEQDWNQDGQKNAEDFRIQTAACDE